MGVLAVVVVGGCAGISTSAPWERDDQQGGVVLFEWRRAQDQPTSQADRLGRFVNPFLWEAALDTLSFMPIADTDSSGGVILSDWYELSDAPGERFKVDVYVLTGQLRVDGLRVVVFRQVLETDPNRWVDARVTRSTAEDLAWIILERARQLRARQAGMS